MKAFSRAGGFDDEAAIYVPDPVLLTRARNLHWSAFAHSHPYGSSPGFLKAEAGSVDAGIMRMVGARFPSLEKDLTSVSGCHNGILFVFNFIPDLKILE